MVLTILVCVSTGYNLYMQKDSSNTPKRTFGYDLSVNKQNIKFVSGNNENLSKKSSPIDRINKTKSRLSSPKASSNYGWYKGSNNEWNINNVWDVNNVWSADLGPSGLSEYGFNRQYTMVNPTYSNRYAHNNSNETHKYSVHSSTLSGKLNILSGGLATYNNQTSRKASDNVKNNSSENITTGTPLAVPFANNYIGVPSTSGGTILFDPGSATNEEIENHTIPVGESGWILLIMAGMYGIVRKKRNRA